jgi:predicted permease
MRWPFTRRHRDLDDEIRSHLALAEADRVDRDEPAGEARAAARREFGNVGLVKQITRDVSAWRIADRLVQDVSHGLRRLRARPSTTALAIAMLGLAVGITTAMFTLVDAFFLRPFPFQDSDRISRYAMRGRTGGRVAVSPEVFRAWRDSGTFEATEAVGGSVDFVLDTPSGPIVRLGTYVTPGLFEMLGAAPIRGRAFDDTEGRGGSIDRVVISENIWRETFDADPGIVGRRIRLGTESVTVVGVMPADFRFPSWSTQIWRPLDFLAPPPGVAELPAVFAKRPASLPEPDALRLATTLAHAADSRTAQLTAADTTPTRQIWSGTQYIRMAVRLLAGGVALVFLVLCTNVSSLLLARFTARRRDVALAFALGASRGRLLWQTSLENLLLGALGAAAGVLIAYWLVAAAGGLLPRAFVAQSLNPVNLDQRALLVAAVLAAVATVVAGLLPAWVATRKTPAHGVLTRTTTETRGARSLSRTFLMAEVALAAMLLIGATLLVRSFVNLSGIDPGFNPSGITSLSAEVDRTLVASPSARKPVVDTAIESLETLPGVTRVVRSNGVPLFASAMVSWDDLQGVEPGAVRLDDAEFETYRVDAEWFELFGVRILRGRTFAAGEDDHNAILGDRLAAALWPAANPVGRAFRWGKDVYHVVGVAQDLRSPVRDLEENYAEIYLPPASADAWHTLSLQCDPACPSDGVLRQRLAQAAPALQVHEVARLDDLYREELSQPRAMATLGLVFGALALVVSAGGLFSVLSHAVGRRRREFGIRLVVGSSPGQIRRLVLREGLLTAGAGILVGAIGGWMMTRSLVSLLYGVTPTDPASWSIVLTILLVATAAGAWQPARRATEIDPAALLRAD